MANRFERLCRTLVSAAVLAVLAEPGNALSDEAKGKDGAYQWGPISLYPTLEAKIAYDSNYLRQEHNPKSSFIYVINPDLGLSIDASTEYGTEWGIKVGAEYAGYQNSPKDGYVNLMAQLDGTSMPTDYLGFYGSVGWELGHEARGTEGTAGYEAYAYNKPVEYQEVYMSGRGEYDFTSKDRFSFEARHEERRYKNFREMTRLRDYDAMRYLAAYHRQLEPNTAMFLSASLNDYDYLHSDLDSRQWQYLLGAEWDVTYQTKGHGSIGWSKKDMIERDTDSGSMFSWELGVDWSPLSYSKVSLNSHGGFEETDSLGDFKKVWGVELEWSHHWTGYIASNVGASYSQEEYQNYTIDSPLDGRTYTGREDDIWDFHAGLEYQARRWLTFSAAFRHENRDSNVPGYSYDDNIIELSARVGLFDAIGNWATRGNL